MTEFLIMNILEYASKVNWRMQIEASDVKMETARELIVLTLEGDWNVQE
jgi:hypothetical protein